MRKAYLLVFSENFGIQEQVKNCLNNSNSILIWRYDMANAFYLISHLNAVEIARELRSNFPSGRFIVSEITSNSYGWLTKGSWHLIQHKELEPDR